MPANIAQTAALVAQPVPPDQECVSNLTQVIQGVVNFTQVLLTQAGTQGGDGSSVADQALQLAQTALAAAQAAQASIPERRSSNEPLIASEGDSNISITWTPDMPDDDYEVNGTFYAPPNLTGFPGVFYVVDGSRTVSGCTLRLCNLPNLPAGQNTSFAWSVTAL